MKDHNSTGAWDVMAFYVVLACCVVLVAVGMWHRHDKMCTIHGCPRVSVTSVPSGAADAAESQPAHRTP